MNAYGLTEDDLSIEDIKYLLEQYQLIAVWYTNRYAKNQQRASSEFMGRWDQANENMRRYSGLLLQAEAAQKREMDAKHAEIERNRAKLLALG